MGPPTAYEQDPGPPTRSLDHGTWVLGEWPPRDDAYLAVFWSRYRKYYFGRVVKTHSTHGWSEVLYDDGERLSHDLRPSANMWYVVAAGPVAMPRTDFADSDNEEDVNEGLVEDAIPAPANNDEDVLEDDVAITLPPGNSENVVEDGGVVLAPVEEEHPSAHSDESVTEEAFVPGRRIEGPKRRRNQSAGVRLFNQANVASDYHDVFSFPFSGLSRPIQSWHSPASARIARRRMRFRMR